MFHRLSSHFRDQGAFQKEKNWLLNKQTRWKSGLLILGFISTLWYIFRVLPKPARATYPCVQAAAPFAAAFVSYISGFAVSIASLVYLRRTGSRQYVSRMALLVLLLVSAFIWIFQPFGHLAAGRYSTNDFEPPNEPIGTARGIYPGRVVWTWNPAATNENCNNEPGDYWWQDENTFQPEVDLMLSDAVQNLTGTTSDAEALDSLFHHYNRTHGNGNHGYIPGEKIVVKVNICSGGWGCVNTVTYEKIAQEGMIDTSPHLILSLLDMLVNKAGVAQEDIYLGDPIRLFFDHYWDMCHTAFPDVHYIDWQGELGREKITMTAGPAMFYSDGTITDSLPQCYVDASYMINIGCLKQHDCAGVTFCAKNHFGSMCRSMAMHLHYSLPSPTVNGFENLGYGKYRNLVDLMMHKDLGEKTMLFIVDGLWGGEFPVSDPEPWDSHPFLGDYPSSLFVSQDHVAIESVCTDFVRAEFDYYAHMEGSDDYQHQAADSANWAEGIVYDPDNDGVLIASLGVHEHWNNDIDKQYTRNLGTGDGIELIQSIITSTNMPASEASGISIFPNPLQQAATIGLKVDGYSEIHLSLFNTNGQMVSSYLLGSFDPGYHRLTIRKGSEIPQAISPGIYLMEVRMSGEGPAKSSSLKVLIED